MAIIKSKVEKDSSEFKTNSESMSALVTQLRERLEQVRQGGGLDDIAKQKLPDLNTTNMDSAKRMIEGTARSMGIEIK